MEVLFMLIGFSVLLALVFLVYFIWAVKTGQYDDNYTPAVRILFDDDKPTNVDTEDQTDRMPGF